jgi:hypothetical protein
MQPVLRLVSHNDPEHPGGSYWRLILDSRVVIGQFWCNRLFLQAFHGGRDRGGIFGKSLLISNT